MTWTGFILCTTKWTMALWCAGSVAVTPGTHKPIVFHSEQECREETKRQATEYTATPPWSDFDWKYECRLNKAVSGD